MATRYRLALVALAALLGTLGPAAAATAQCTLDYQRADNMWADWGRPDGFLGLETITLAAGEKRVLTTDWAYEKKRNDGTNYYGSHLRVATNRGTQQVHLQLRGPGSFRLLLATGAALGGLATNNVLPINPGERITFRHDLMEVRCPTAPVTRASAPVATLLSILRSTLASTGSTITVHAADPVTGAALSGKVTINGVQGVVGQPITFPNCTAQETIEIEDLLRGTVRTRVVTVQVPCEGTVEVAGRPLARFTS